MTMPDDRDLEKLLSDDGGEWGALYRKLSRVEPPRRLDRNVLGEAARAVHGHVPRGQRWLVGLGSAAGIVLAAGIAWHVGHEGVPPAAAPAPETPAASAPRRQYVPVQTFDESARRATPKTEAPASSAVAPSPGAPPPPAAAKPRPPAPAQPAPAAQASPKPEQHRVITPSAAPQAAVANDTMQDAASKAAARPDAGAVAPAPAEERESRDVHARARDASPEALTRSQEIRNDMRMPPEVWIRRIQWLLEQGRDEQAIESLHLLRRMHPGVELPDDLKELQ